MLITFLVLIKFLQVVLLLSHKLFTNSVFSEKKVFNLKDDKYYQPINVSIKFSKRKTIVHFVSTLHMFSKVAEIF